MASPNIQPLNANRILLVPNHQVEGGGPLLIEANDVTGCYVEFDVGVNDGTSNDSTIFQVEQRAVLTDASCPNGGTSSAQATNSIPLDSA